MEANANVIVILAVIRRKIGSYVVESIRDSAAYHRNWLGGHLYRGSHVWGIHHEVSVFG